jgi:hypothetical protein
MNAKYSANWGVQIVGMICGEFFLNEDGVAGYAN